MYLGKKRGRFVSPNILYGEDLARDVRQAASRKMGRLVAMFHQANLDANDIEIFATGRKSNPVLYVIDYDKVGTSVGAANDVYARAFRGNDPYWVKPVTSLNRGVLDAEELWRVFIQGYREVFPENAGEFLLAAEENIPAQSPAKYCAKCRSRI